MLDGGKNGYTVEETAVLFASYHSDDDDGSAAVREWGE